MHPEIRELQSKLKEILYDCAVDVKATKAALYLYDDGEGLFDLITQYGFRGGLAEKADNDDPLIDRCGRGRTAFFINGLTVEPRFSEKLYEASTDRLLAAPIYLRGKLVGVIDMRDKSGKALFEQSDLPKAQRIADRIAELFAKKNVFGQRFITLASVPEAAVSATPPAPAPAQTSPAAAPAVRTVTPPPQPAAAPPPRPAPPPAPPQPSPQFRVPGMILEARAAAERIIRATPAETLTDAELATARALVQAVLLVPNATVASFSAFGHLGGVQEIAARGMLTDEARTLLQSKLNVWLAKRGEAGGQLRPPNIHYPFGTSGPAVMPSLIVKVFTAPVVAGSLRGLYLTVGFGTNPDRVAHEMLAAFHAQLQMAIEHSMTRGSAAGARWRIAEKLLEPDFSHYPELRRHSDAVVSRVDAFARFIALTQQEVDTARVTALVHDVGLRLLDYERLYRKRDVSQDEMAILQEHVAVGAALVEPLLGNEVARAVLCHHERWDGRGYPNGLSGEAIPRLARVIQICDAYETMISTDSYHPPEPPPRALETLTRNAGAQFDPELVHRFAEMIVSGGR